MKILSKLNLFFLSAFFLSIACNNTFAGNPANTLPEKGPVRLATVDRTLPNGIYLILREDSEEGKLEPLAKKEQSLINDSHFLDAAYRDKTTYVVVSSDEFVPIIVSGDPVKDKTDDGKPKILIQLAKSQIEPLEQFTRKHCGKKVAIVIGGEVVTAHKVREPITGGRLQISYCTCNGCNVLYSMLQGDKTSVDIK